MYTMRRIVEENVLQRAPRRRGFRGAVDVGVEAIRPIAGRKHPKGDSRLLSPRPQSKSTPEAVRLRGFMPFPSPDYCSSRRLNTSVNSKRQIMGQMVPSD